MDWGTAPAPLAYSSKKGCIPKRLVEKERPRSSAQCSVGPMGCCSLALTASEGAAASGWAAASPQVRLRSWCCPRAFAPGASAAPAEQLGGCSPMSHWRVLTTVPSGLEGVSLQPGGLPDTMVCVWQQRAGLVNHPCSDDCWVCLLASYLGQGISRDPNPHKCSARALTGSSRSFVLPDLDLKYWQGLLALVGAHEGTGTLHCSRAGPVGSSMLTLQAGD